MGESPNDLSQPMQLKAKYEEDQNNILETHSMKQGEYTLPLEHKSSSLYKITKGNISKKKKAKNDQHLYN